jgi:predicted nucleotidyltransferase
MKNLDEIKEILKSLKQYIKQNYKAEIIGIFGSFVRNEQKQGSDIDILVKFYENATLFDFIGLSIFLEEKLGIRVDIVPQDVVREEIKENIMHQVVNEERY